MLVRAERAPLGPWTCTADRWISRYQPPSGWGCRESRRMMSRACILSYPRAVKIIAVTNIKGGVGKTTTAVNLAYLNAARGHPTVLWDLDPQGAATYLLRGEPAKPVSARKLVTGKRELPEVVLPTRHENLDLLPADFS